MNNIGKYCLGGFALAVVGFLCWYFSSIIAYILIAVIISFLGRPVMNCLERLEIKGYHIPEGLRAAIALICIWVVFILFFYTVIPLVSQEFQSLSDISITNIVNKLEDPLADLEQGLKRFGILEYRADTLWGRCGECVGFDSKIADALFYRDYLRGADRDGFKYIGINDCGATV